MDSLCFSGAHIEEFDDMDDEMEEENIDDEDDEKVWVITWHIYIYIDKNIYFISNTFY